jgi:hypothetical protein
MPGLNTRGFLNVFRVRDVYRFLISALAMLGGTFALAPCAAFDRFRNMCGGNSSSGRWHSYALRVYMVIFNGSASGGFAESGAERSNAMSIDAPSGVDACLPRP